MVAFGAPCIYGVPPTPGLKSRGSQVKQGEFIEETLGVAQREDILQNGPSTEHERLAIDPGKLTSNLKRFPEDCPF